MRLDQLACKLNCELRGEGHIEIIGVATLAQAQPGYIAFLDNAKYTAQLATTKASAVIVREAMVSHAPCAVLVTASPYAAYAKAAQCFDTRPLPAPGIHPSAIIAASAKIDSSVRVGPGVIIGEDVVIDAHGIIGAACVIGDGVVIGAHTRLHASVTLYDHVMIGRHCAIHSGAVIGSDGFGYAPTDDGWMKVPQLGRVCVGDYVEIGANTTIDRGAIDDTVIGRGVIIDNQVQIAHNVEIGEFTAIAGCVGIAGSTRIGRHCLIGGAVGINGHITIADRVVLTGMAMVTHSITQPGMYSSGTGILPSNAWRRAAVRFRQLDDLAERIAQLEAMIK